MKTGGTNFQKQTIQARTLASHPSGPSGPMQPQGGGAPIDWKQGMYQGHFPQQPYPSQTMVAPMAMGPYSMIPPAQPFGMVSRYTYNVYMYSIFGIPVVTYFISVRLNL